MTTTLNPAVSARPRKIVVAFDKFKGTLTAAQACAIGQRVLQAVAPEWEIVAVPLADGGEGTAAVLLTARGGDWVPVVVTGPRPERRVAAGYGWCDRDRLAVVEMAAASGLGLLREADRDPLRTTTAGTGELLRAAAARGAQRILLAVGGSATVDGGVGAATALGWRFLDRHGRPVGPGGGELERIAKVMRPATLALPPIEVLCDVDNPLCGIDGAARVFGPQKGATPAMVARLEAGLERLARVVREQLGIAMADQPGGGAAGGLAAGAVAFLGARLVPGAAAVMTATDLESHLCKADWVVTGEGCFDEQSLRGKVVGAVTKLAGRCGAKVAVLAGTVTLAESAYHAAGVDVALETRPPGLPLAEVLAQAETDLAAAVRVLATTCLRSGR